MVDVGAKAAIATPHHLATVAGAEALAAGGTALDAALAAAVTLCVVYPGNVALGGDLVAAVRSPQGDVRFLNATGPSPRNLTLAHLRRTYGDALPLRSIDTVTVPGGVQGWHQLHDYGARLPWASHFDAAIRHARDGFANSRSVAAALLEVRSLFEADPGGRDAFYPGGRPVAEGDILAQPALADTLAHIAREGAHVFYDGDVARQWTSWLSALGSAITMDDTSGYRAAWEPVIERGFRGLRVVTSPPNTQGFVLLRALAAIERGIPDPLGAGAGRLARAFADAHAVRRQALGDPVFGALDGDGLVDVAAPRESVAAGPKPTGDTVGISAVSADGWAVSLINSVYHAFGACVLDPGTGVIFQNRGTSFSLHEGRASVFAPGKRPPHTLMPVLVLHGDEPAWVPATMGGRTQPQIHAQLLLHSLAGASPAKATHAPRWAVQDPGDDGVIRVLVEEDLPAATVEALSRSGLPLTTVPARCEDLGHANLIRVASDGAATAASDPRSDGSAILVAEDGSQSVITTEE